MTKADILDRLHETVTLARNERADRKLTHRVKADLYVQEAKGATSDAAAGLLFFGAADVQRLLGSVAGVQKVVLGAPPAGSAAGSVRQGIELTLLFEVPADAVEAVDLSKVRLELAKVDDNIAKVSARLASEEFTAKAPAAVIEGARKNLEALQLERARLVAAIGSDHAAS